MDHCMAEVKTCKFCRTDLNDENAFSYEVREGVKLFRNSCKPCFMKHRRSISGTKKVEGKVCPNCNEYKISSMYGVDNSRSDGISSNCKTCRTRYNYSGRLRRNFNITENQLFEMTKSQEGKCLCCRFEGKLVLDHCHTSGKVRGLLCSQCNMALGLVKDSKDTLHRMFIYVGG